MIMRRPVSALAAVGGILSSREEEGGGVPVHVLLSPAAGRIAPSAAAFSTDRRSGHRGPIFHARPGRHRRSFPTELFDSPRGGGVGGGEGSAKSSVAKSSSGRWTVVLTALSLLTACAVAAKAGLLPGGPDGAPQYADSMILRDVGATVLTAALGHAFVWINTAAVSAGRLDPRDARKSIHTLSAPLFMLFWPLFSEAAGARFFAATVPTVNAVRLYLASQTDRQQQQEEETEAVSSEAALAAAVSRSGDSREALGGPFIYVVVLAVCILLWWRDSPAGVVALAALAAGDGAADLVGRRYGSVKWPWSADGKSVAGSAAFWVSSTLTAVGLLRWMQWTGCLTVLADVPVTEWAAKVALICFVSAALEVMPAAGDDNYTVPISAALLSVVLL